MFWVSKGKEFGEKGEVKAQQGCPARSRRSRANRAFFFFFLPVSYNLGRKGCEERAHKPYLLLWIGFAWGEYVLTAPRGGTELQLPALHRDGGYGKLWTPAQGMGRPALPARRDGDRSLAVQQTFGFVFHRYVRTAEAARE